MAEGDSLLSLGELPGLLRGVRPGIGEVGQTTDMGISQALLLGKMTRPRILE